MKKATLLIAALALLAGASAKPVDQAILYRIADNFFPGRQVVVTPYADAMYIATPVLGPGFLVLAGDDCIRPVLAWSEGSMFSLSSMPEHVEAWFDAYAREIASLLDAGIGQSAQVAAEWQRWSGTFSPKNEGDTIAPMLTSAWNQGTYFNTLCPFDNRDSIHCYTGCTATATAQIMNYWEHPAIGWGSHSYYHPMYGMLSAQFDTTYYPWSMMPDTLNYLTDPDSALAVAELMYHVGVAVEMNYGTHGSGAAVNSYGNATRPSAENALKTYFKYNPMLYGVFKSSYTDSEWDALMHSEVAAGRPVLYAGFDTSGGHAFVLDGYQHVDDSLGSRHFFHVNWGWGGHYDGYYTLDSLAPGSGGIGGNSTYTFNLSNSAVVGIMPATSASDSIVSISVSPSNYLYGTVSGSGNYIPGVDQVTIWAHAAEGYRFVGWKSGSLQNPLSFVAMGDLVDTAVFEPLRGDTLGYCFDGLVTSWADDYTSTTEWGIRIPPSMRSAGRSMTAVQFFPYESGDHTLNIYIGSNLATATLVHTQTLAVTGNEYYRWSEFPLTDSLPVLGTDVVWVTLSSTGSGGYPAAMSRYCGNSDGSWYHQPEGWVQFDVEDIIFGTWMLRAVFVPHPVTVTVQPADPEVCSTYGEGDYLGGDQVTVGAVMLDPRCTFSNWGNGVIDNPYTFTAAEDIHLVAHCDCPLDIDEVDAEMLRVVVDGRTVNVSVDAEFYDLQGRLLAQGRQAAMPAAGVYVVRAAGAAKKVVVL